MRRWSMKNPTQRGNTQTMLRSGFIWKGYIGHRLRWTGHILRKEESSRVESIFKTRLKAEDQPEDPREYGGTKFRRIQRSWQ